MKLMKLTVFLALAILIISCGDDNSTNNNTIDFETVKIGDKEWTVENYAGTMFSNGDTIPQAMNATEWNDALRNKQPAWCYYGFDAGNGAVYGKIYNFYAIIDERGFAPGGWKVPTNEQWNSMAIALGGKSKAGDKLRAAGTTYWNEPNTGTDESGFKALPGGQVTLSSESVEMGASAYFWTSSEFTTDDQALFKKLVNDNSELMQGNADRGTGMSVRLVKN